ncbi:MAG: ABC transporter ATP-binding protein [Sphingobacteriales bacterium JAD_PAG50586_3]|nr:MAG: ABC transporter ATP-binding protein [Sphingobacteriales bacterium JAD_PAG50586_3]
MAQPIVNIDSVYKQYGTFKAVDGISLTIDEGDIYGFLGPNGAGKSTTLRMLLSLIKPTAGSIEIMGKSLDKSRNDILAETGSIIEKPDFYLYLSAKQNLWLLSKMYNQNIGAKRIQEVIQQVGLSGRENDKVKTYSHGMKQRLGLAQALLHNPKLIILDEPTTGLDPQGIIELRELILKLKNEGKTVVLSSHILSEIQLIADSMVIINNGKAVAQGKVNSLLGDDDVVVYVELADTEKFNTEIGQSGFVAALTGIEHNVAALKLAKQEIPHLVSWLNDKGIAFYALDYKKGWKIIF